MNRDTLPERNRRFTRSATALAASLFSFFGPRAEELIYFRDQRSVHLPATEADGKVRLETPLGTRTFDRAQVARIVAGYSPEKEWPDRWRAARTGTAAERRAAIDWALGQGLVREALASIGEMATRDAADVESAAIVESSKSLESPWAEREADFDSILKLAPGASTAIARSDHFILIHQHAAADAAERLEHMEMVLAAFWLGFRRLGFPLERPREKMVAIWFADAEAYRAYLRAERSDSFLITRGYYHPTRRLLSFYDARSDPERRRTRAEIRSKQDRLEELRAQLEAMPKGSRLRIARGDEPAKVYDRAGARAFADSLSQEIDLDLLIWDLEWRTIDLAVSAHELVHALVAATRLAPSFDSFPIWLHEGLATQFEPVRGGRWGGIDGANTLRLKDLSGVPSPSPLESLLRDAGLERGYNMQAYARSWAFVGYLRARHPAGFVGLLDALRRPSAVRRQAVPGAVAAACGQSVEELERDWNAWMKSLESPLESHRPK